MPGRRTNDGLGMLASRSLENSFFLTTLLIVTVAFIWLLDDFFQPVFWAALLATVFHPGHRWLLPRLGGRRSTSALLVLLLILLLVILPVFFVGMAVTRESAALYERIASGEIDLRAPLRWATQQAPIVQDFLDRAGVTPERISENLSSAAVTVSQFLASRALAIGQNALRFVLQFALMLYLLFFFLRDGGAIIDRIVHALPLGDQRERHLLAKFKEVSRATLRGTLVVGIVQGTIGGVTFALLGIRGAVFWGVVMTVLSILPPIGAGLVWLPTAIVLIATGELLSGIILIAVGVLVIGLVDNVLRPILVGRDTRMPDYLVLLSTLGGLTAFGISGIVIGPIIAALFLACWEMFATDFHMPALPPTRAPTTTVEERPEKSTEELP